MLPIGVGVGIGVGVATGKQGDRAMAFGHETLDVYRASIGY
jgi:hypothetical protein